MAKMTSIVIRPEWYEDLKWGLEQAKARAKRKPQRSTASTALRTLESGQKKFDQGKWEQLPFTMKEVELLGDISEVVGLDDAARRFRVKPVKAY